MVKENNAWVNYPMKGSKIFIKGYNEDGVVLQNMTLYLGGDGTKTFMPLVAGDYLIETLIQQQTIDQQDPVTKLWETTFAVGENPIADRGIVAETPTGAAIIYEEEPPEPEVIEEPAETTMPQNRGPFDFVMNGTCDKESKDDASSFMLMVVGLLIS